MGDFTSTESSSLETITATISPWASQVLVMVKEEQAKQDGIVMYAKATMYRKTPAIPLPFLPATITLVRDPETGAKLPQATFLMLAGSGCKGRVYFLNASRVLKLTSIEGGHAKEA